jgi:hypothetical protein
MKEISQRGQEMLCVAVPFVWLLHLRFMPSHFLIVLVMSLRKGYQKMLPVVAATVVAAAVLVVGVVIVAVAVAVAVVVLVLVLVVVLVGGCWRCCWWCEWW